MLHLTHFRHELFIVIFIRMNKKLCFLLISLIWIYLDIKYSEQEDLYP